MRRQVTCDVCHGREEIKRCMKPVMERGMKSRLTAFRWKSPAGVETGQQASVWSRWRALMAAHMVTLCRGSSWAEWQVERDGSTIYYKAQSQLLFKQLLVTVWIFQLFTEMLSWISQKEHRLASVFRLRGKEHRVCVVEVWDHGMLLSMLWRRLASTTVKKLPSKNLRRQAISRSI